MHRPRPHISVAIQKMLFWTTACCVVLVAAAVVRLVCFGFVHYTDLRYADLRPDSAGPGGVVVDADGTVKVPARDALVVARQLQEQRAAGIGVEGLPINRVLSPTDVILRRVADQSAAAAVLASMLLAAVTLVGVAVAGGARVPGVDKAVNAAVWALLLCLACLPMRDVLPSLPLPGLITGYDELVRRSADAQASRLSEMVLLALEVGLPVALLLSACVVGLSFRAGVESGVVLSTIADLEAAVEQEMRSIAAKGGSGGAGRAGAALSRTLGSVKGAPDGPLMSAAEGPAGIVPTGAIAVANGPAYVGSGGMAGAGLGMMGGAGHGMGSTGAGLKGAPGAIPDSGRPMGAPSPGTPMARPI